MCTISVLREGDALLVTMNRDELDARGAELPPRLWAGEGGRQWLSPIDGDGGGTWFGVNDQGVVGALLNWYTSGGAPPRPRESVRRSRGLLVQRILAGACLDGVVGESEVRCFGPFTLLRVTRERSEWLRWRGQGRPEVNQSADPCEMMTSSAYRPEVVEPWRRTAFEQWRSAGGAFEGALPSFHRLRVPDAPEQGPLMARGDARTRSIAQVRVRPAAGTAELCYWPEPTTLRGVHRLQLSIR